MSNSKKYGYLDDINEPTYEDLVGADMTDTEFELAMGVTLEELMADDPDFHVDLMAGDSRMGE